MKQRYFFDGNVEHGCCYEYAIYDRQHPNYYYGKRPGEPKTKTQWFAEARTKEQAELICRLLNEHEQQEDK